MTNKLKFITFFIVMMVVVSFVNEKIATWLALLILVGMIILNSDKFNEIFERGVF